MSKHEPTAEGTVTFLHPLDVKEDPGNPRTISTERLDALKYALEHATGMLLARPVIIDTDGVGVGGNQRLRASREMIGDINFPKFNEWVKDHHGIPFFIKDFGSDAERREWVFRDNQPYGEYETEKVAAMVKAHDDAGGDMALLGFADEDLSALLKAADKPVGAGIGAGSDPMPDVWGIVVECQDEQQQGELLEELNDRGITCRALL